jgi:hypothetical protein
VIAGLVSPESDDAHCYQVLADSFRCCCYMAEVKIAGDLCSLGKTVIYGKVSLVS